MTPSVADCPRVSGPADGRYLSRALARAGRRCANHGALRFTSMTDGRTGAEVTEISNGSGNDYVLKAVPFERGFAEGLGNDGEGRFWLAGTTRDLPGELVNPTLDVACHGERGQWWLLMDDVTADIRSRGQWHEAHSRRLFEAVAALHARHWHTPPDTAAGTLAGTTAVFVETALHAATGVASAPWVARAAQEFRVAGNLMPAFLDALGPENADFYIDICRHWSNLVAALERFPQTLIHGDLRWANIAITDDTVVLFDWEFCARAPAAVDLTWHWFFAYWAYPRDGNASPDAQRWLRDAYLMRLETLLGRTMDRSAFNRSWDLGWLRVFCQLGFLLADPLTEADATDDAVKRALQRCRIAVDYARRVADVYVG